MPPLCFVDTETTGLSPQVHEMYEVSLQRADDDGTMQEEKYFWIEPMQLQHASSGALHIGRFYERRDQDHVTGSRIVGEEMRYETAMEIGRFTEGCHLVGAKPDFDAGFLTAFLRNNGAAPAWHHRLIDVEALAIGLLVLEGDDWGRPQSLSWICEELEIPRLDHNARDDCESVRRAYFKLMEIAEERAALWGGKSDG
jgi:DNA polymerase III alpha subunit (gram-positive type)